MGVLLLWALMSGPVVGQTDAPRLRAELAPLEFLAGLCWRGEFPDEAGFEVQCFEPIFSGVFLRHVRAVPREGGGELRGEILYHWDAVEREIRFRYYSPLGAVEDGSVRPEGELLRFSDEIRWTELGQARVISSSFQRISEDAYLAVSTDITDAVAIELIEIRFERISREAADALVEGGL
tara:strand:- start:1086 stop:1625 length:540 start_codon:yes stop_codon:yes gene_type:complete